jgi:hypothetical protein
MTRNVRFPAFLALALVCSLASFGQDRYTWRTGADISDGARGNIVGTVADVDEARNRLTIDPDERGPQAYVAIDSVSTQFNGFGGVINGQPEIFTGSQGLANVRVADRIEVRGMGQANQTIRADHVSLLGRPVAAPQTGVGTTRSPNSVMTPGATSTSTSDRVGPVEGVVQQVNAADGRIVIVTDRREVMTVRTSTATPVYYRNETYRVANLEVGDRIRVTPDVGGSSGGELRAGSIEVTRSTQEGKATPTGSAVSGRVASIDRTLDIVTIDTGKQSIRVDVATASDQQGRRVRALDFRSGDRVEINGRYSPTTSNLFVANTVRWADEPVAAPRPSSDTTASRPAGTTEDVFATPPAAQELGAVTIYGTVRETLANSPQLVLRDNQGRTIRLNVLEDFIVRNKTSGYTTADRLKDGDSVVVKAFRDPDGNYIAQTIRLR